MENEIKRIFFEIKETRGETIDTDVDLKMYNVSKFEAIGILYTHLQILTNEVKTEEKQANAST